LITGLSIQKQNGTKDLDFTYNATSRFPDRVESDPEGDFMGFG
jgi:hypothetical protein